MQSNRKELIKVLLVFVGAMVGCVFFMLLGRLVPFMQSNLHAFIAAIFLYVPTAIINKNKENYDSYGLSFGPIGKGLLVFFAVSAVVFPPYILGTFYYYKVVCERVSSGAWVPSLYTRLCRHFIKSWSDIRLRFPPRFGHMVLAQVLVVALPEEYFFRGYMQTKLEQVWPSKRKFLGVPVGIALLVTSILFALGHLVVDLNGLRLAVFFPALVFGWMRQASGSIFAGVLFHALCNIFSDFLHTIFF